MSLVHIGPFSVEIKRLGYFVLGEFTLKAIAVQGFEESRNTHAWVFNCPPIKSRSSRPFSLILSIAAREGSLTPIQDSGAVRQCRTVRLQDKTRLDCLKWAIWI
jgi:hypothetical protein